MKTYFWNDLSPAERTAALARPAGRSDPALQASVRAIVDDVRARGWDALVEQATRIDGAAPRLVPVAQAAARARATLSRDQIDAIELAHRNVTAFHVGSLPADHAVETMPGLSVRKTWRAINRVGLYVPGGKTPLFSTLLMLAIPARAAGVEEIVVVTPPRFSSPAKAGVQPLAVAKAGPRPSPGYQGAEEISSLDPVLALAAELCGIPAIWTVGGAQAIAALAFGAGDIPRVAKICGPGNAWVAEAKSYVSSLSGGPAIDMPAGPSELLVIADSTADPARVAADLLSQAEHDPSAQVVLVTLSADFAEAAVAELTWIAEDLPRAAIAQASLANARAIIVGDLAQAVAVSNRYAPEHLSLAVADPDALIPAIRNAGAIFAGHLAAETFGDYLAGPSHVLPTDGAARAWSGISTHSFMKSITVQHVTPEAAVRIAAPAATLARMEGLEAHARAADMRLATSLPCTPAKAGAQPSGLLTGPPPSRGYGRRTSEPVSS